jgi:hypothetical protein
MSSFLLSAGSCSIRVATGSPLVTGANGHGPQNESSLTRRPREDGYHFWQMISFRWGLLQYPCRLCTGCLLSFLLQLDLCSPLGSQVLKILWMQAHPSCCATLQEVLQYESNLPRRFRRVLLHLDNAFLTCCVGGTVCIRSVLAQAARCLHSQCLACKECSQQLQGQPSTSAFAEQANSDSSHHEALVAWIEVHTLTSHQTVVSL